MMPIMLKATTGILLAAYLAVMGLFGFAPSEKIQSHERSTYYTRSYIIEVKSAKQVKVSNKVKIKRDKNGMNVEFDLDKLTGEDKR